MVSVAKPLYNDGDILKFDLHSQELDRLYLPSYWPSERRADKSRTAVLANHEADSKTGMSTY